MTSVTMLCPFLSDKSTALQISTECTEEDSTAGVLKYYMRNSTVEVQMHPTRVGWGFTGEIIWILPAIYNITPLYMRIFNLSGLKFTSIIPLKIRGSEWGLVFSVIWP